MLNFKDIVSLKHVTNGDTVVVSFLTAFSNFDPSQQYVNSSQLDRKSAPDCFVEHVEAKFFYT